jgi:hypothetical protein
VGGLHQLFIGIGQRCPWWLILRVGERLAVKGGSDFRLPANF